MATMAGRLTAFVLALVWVAGSAAMAEEKSQRLAQAYNATGYALFEQLAGKSGNTVISPYSIGAVMAMVTAGARGKTADELVKILHMPAGPDGIGQYVEAFDKDIAEPARGEDAELALANALHLTRDGDVIAPAYRELLKAKFGAEIFEGSDLEAVNGWVADKTKGRIEDILDQLDPLSVAVLVNAVYFKAGWDAPFRESATAPADFHLSAQETVQVPTMHVTGHFPVVSTEEFDALALPYKGKRFAMVVVQPKKPGETAGEVAIRPTRESMSDVIDKLVSSNMRRLDLSMPKFRTKYGADLIPPLTELGLKLSFDSDRADFSGITGGGEEKERISISQVRHKAFIEIDENGTEAAAATAVEFTTRAMPAPPVPFAVDKPFLYMVVELRTGAVLFLGRVSDPRNQ